MAHNLEDASRVESTTELELVGDAMELLFWSSLDWIVVGCPLEFGIEGAIVLGLSNLGDERGDPVFEAVVDTIVDIDCGFLLERRGCGFGLHLLFTVFTAKFGLLNLAPIFWRLISRLLH